MSPELQVDEKDTVAGNEIMSFLRGLCARRMVSNHRILKVMAQMVGIFCARLGFSPSVASEIMQEAFHEESRDLNTNS